LSHLLSQAQAGHPIEVTSHQKVIARIIGVPDDATEGLRQLIASGAASWRGGKPKGASIQIAHGNRPGLTEGIIEDRG